VEIRVGLRNSLSTLWDFIEEELKGALFIYFNYESSLQDWKCFSYRRYMMMGSMMWRSDLYLAMIELIVLCPRTQLVELELKSFKAGLAKVAG
jgi:hypothetical protein